MSNLFITSDTHLGHLNIIKFRVKPNGDKFETPEEHDEYIRRMWNERIGSDDTVIVVGDFVMGHKRETLPYNMERLNGNVNLIPGNHDGPWFGNKPEKRQEWTEFYEECGVSVWEDPALLLFGNNMVDLHHLPYQQDDRHGEQYAEYHPQDVGRALIHGHVHDMWRVNGRQINVGVDVWGLAPVPAPRLIELVDEVVNREKAE